MSFPVIKSLIRSVARLVRHGQRIDPVSKIHGSGSVRFPDTGKGIDDENVEQLRDSLDEENKRRLDTCMAEYEVFKYADSRMPSRINVKGWKRLLSMKSKTERIDFFTFLYETERLTAKDEANKVKKQQLAVEITKNRRAEIKRLSEQHLYYGIGGNCIFRRIMDSDMNKRSNTRLATAMTHGPHLIFDMSYYPIMKPIEASLTSKQLSLVHCDNRLHRFPHHIMFTGCNRQHPSWEDVEKYFHDGGLDSLLYTVTDKHYLDLFPKERLVYLTPDARQTVNEYDPGKVYIVGALVDRVPRPNLTLGRAKEEGIEARRLPFERCMRLVGAGSLCLNHIVGIMNDAHAYGSITTAILNNMPKRKIVVKKSERPRERREYNRQRKNYLRTLGPSE